WAHAGQDLSEAAAAAPKLWARGVFIAPVHQVHLTSDDGRVAATWMSEPGIDRVEVHRFPASDTPAGPAVSDTSVVSGDLSGSNLSGFVEEHVPPGEYVYRFHAVSVVDGVVYRSTPVDEHVTV